MRRWLKYRRLKKCAQGGHKLPKPTRRRYYQWPPKHWTGVADRVVVDIAQCRCGRRKSIKEISRTNLNGLTMSSSDWDTLRADGILID